MFDSFVKYFDQRFGYAGQDNDIHEALIPEAEGGEVIQSSDEDEHLNVRREILDEFKIKLRLQHGVVAEQIPVTDNDLKLMTKKSQELAGNTPYQIFKQSYFDYQATTVKPCTTIDQLTKELNSLDLDQSKQKSNKIVIKPEYRKQRPETSPYQEIFDRNKDGKPAQADPSADENFIKMYLKTFKDKLDSKLTKRLIDSKNDDCFEATDLKQILKDIGAQDSEEEEDELDEKSEKSASKKSEDQERQLIHRSLIMTSKPNKDFQLVEVRKVFRFEDHDEKVQGKLYMEIVMFHQDRSLQMMEQIELASFDGDEPAKLFNNNFECLFNHLHINDKLYFFSIQPDTENIDELAIYLNYYQFYQDPELEESPIKVIFKYSVDSMLKGRQQKLLGIIFIKGLEDHNSLDDPNLEQENLDTARNYASNASALKAYASNAVALKGFDSKQPNRFRVAKDFFFALIYIDYNHEQEIKYDVRHISEPTHTISSLQIQDDVKDEGYRIRDHVMIKIPADTIFYQMLLTEKMNNEALKLLKNKINDKRAKREKRKGNNMMLAQISKSIQRTSNFNAMGQGQADGDPKSKQLYLIVLGSLNTMVFDKVQDVAFVDNDLNMFEPLELLKIQDVNDMKDMLNKYLRILSFQNTSHQVKFDAGTQSPVIYDKKLCRGQIETIKRLLTHEHNQIVLDKTRKSNISESTLDTNQFESTMEGSNMQSDQLAQPKLKKDLINSCLQNYACATIINYIHRTMIILMYDKSNRLKQYMFTLKLNSYNQISDTKQLKATKPILTKGYNQIFQQAFVQLFDKSLRKKVAKENLGEVMLTDRNLTDRNEADKNEEENKEQQVKSEKNDYFFNPKFIISKKYDNIAKDLNNIYWLNKDELVVCNEQEFELNNVTQLRSRFQIRSEEPEYQTITDNTDKIILSKDFFIYALVKDQGPSKNHKQFEVLHFQNFTQGKQRSQLYKEIEEYRKMKENLEKSGKKIQKAIPSDVFENTIEIADIMLESSQQNKNDFVLGNIILQNVILTEDDREEIPVLSIGKNYESLQFAILHYNQIKAIATVKLNKAEFKQTIDTNNESFNAVYPRFFQFCTSSEIMEGKDKDGNSYMYQNYTIAIFFQKQLRFRMDEYQVRWIQNSTSGTEPYKIEILLIKIRDIVFKRVDEKTGIDRYMIVPLYEKLKLKEKGQKDKADTSYQITGIQLILKFKGNKKGVSRFHYVNFRNKLNDDQYDLEDQKTEINYNNHLITSKAKFINQHLLEGVYVESEFKHQRQTDQEYKHHRKADLSSDYVHSGIFDDQQSFSMLRETNINALNSFPIDFVGLMDIPEINQEWFQSERIELNIDETKSKKIPLQVDEIIHLNNQTNFKKYFNAWEILDGQQMINMVGSHVTLEEQNNGQKASGDQGMLGSVFSSENKNQEGQKDQSKSRDPGKIINIFKRLNQQQDDRKYDFKFMKNITTPVFGKTLIERALMSDFGLIRFRNLRTGGLIQDGKDVICSNMDLQSVIQYPLMQEDTKMTDLYIKELYENNQYSENKYSQMMRILPMLYENYYFNSYDYFQFFIDSDEQDNNDDVDRNVPQETDIDNQVIQLKDDFKIDEKADFITFSQFFPLHMQEQMNVYTKHRVQLFQDDTIQNAQNLTKSSTMSQAFNLLQTKYQSGGSKYQVKAVYVNFKPFVMGKKLMSMETAQTIEDINNANKYEMNDYQLSMLVNYIMNVTDGSIEDQRTLRDIIDQQFEKTKKFFYINLTIYVFGYFLPLIHQMQTEKASDIYFCNMCCLTVQIYCLVYEMISLYWVGRKEYFNEFWNVLDLTTMAVYFCYFIIRMQNPGHAILNLQDDDKKYTKEWMQKEMAFTFKYYSPAVHVLLILISFLKLMYFLRCNSAFGQFVQLVLQCVYEVRIFAYFFVAWVIIFGKLFQIAGTKFDEAEYPTLPGLAFYFQTYRNSIGDIAPPGYDYWSKILKHFQDTGVLKKEQYMNYPQMMIYVIWVIWFFNQFFNFVLLLNFLIAIVSQSYDQVVAQSKTYEYSHKSELNCETQRFFRMFRKPSQFDIMCIVSSHDHEDDSQDQMRGLSQTLRSYMKTQVSKINDEFQSRFDRNDRVSEIAEHNLKKFVDNQFADNMQQLGKIQGLMDLMKRKIEQGSKGNMSQRETNRDNKMANLEKLISSNLVSTLEKEQNDRHQGTIELKRAIENVVKTSQDRQAQEGIYEEDELTLAETQKLKAEEEMQRAIEKKVMVDGANAAASEKLDLALETIKSIQETIQVASAETSNLKNQFVESQKKIASSQTAILSSREVVEDQMLKFDESKVFLEAQTKMVEDNQSQILTQTKSIDDFTQLLEKMNASFPEQMESSLQELSQDFEKKLEELKSQSEIPMAEDSEIKD